VQELKSEKTVSEYNIEVIESLDRFQEIQSDWDRLFNLKNEIPLFFSFEVVLTYYKTILMSFKKVHIRIFIIRNANQQIVAIFPFTYEVIRFSSIFSFRELGMKNSYLIDFYYFLVDPSEDQNAIFRLFYQYLKKRKKEWDVVKVNFIPDDENLFNVFISNFSKSYKINVDEIETVVIDCDRGFDQYIKDLDRKDMKNIKRQDRRIKENGIVSLVEMKNPQEIEKGLQYFYDIEDSGWKGAEGTSLKRSYYGDYFKELAIDLSKENRFRLYFLRFNDRYIAGIYGIIDHGTLYIVKTGYDDTYSQYSPSIVLYYLLFERLFNEKSIQKIDFYGPAKYYEKNFGKKTRKRYKVTICNRKIFSTLYFIFLQILKIIGYPFAKDSLRDKFMTKIMHLYR
jgi:CelD/BcsL family acetyltransferase involved in cellulose biosynthesis